MQDVTWPRNFARSQFIKSNLQADRTFIISGFFSLFYAPVLTFRARYDLKF